MNRMKRIFLGCALAASVATAAWVSSVAGASETRRSPVGVTAVQDTQLPGQSVTHLPDGRWLFLGGVGPSGPVASAAIMDAARTTTTVLAMALIEGRAYHTATVLPDGTVLIAGGRGANGQILASAERFDPTTGVFAQVLMGEATPRAYHTATVLTDGRVLLAGGIWADGVASPQAELWDLDAQLVLGVPGARMKLSHSATLLSDGRVLLSGGVDTAGQPIAEADVYNPTALRVEPFTGQLPDDGGVPTVGESRPANGDIDVPVAVRPVLRMSHGLRPETVNSQTVRLTEAGEPVATLVVAAEDGRLVFVQPLQPLDGNSAYTLTLEGALDAAGVLVVPASITFTTTTQLGQTVDDDTVWVPNQSGEWKIHGPDSSWRRLPPLTAAPGTTAVSGQVLTLNGKPLENVTLSVDAATTKTNNKGQFLLELDPSVSGHQELLIDGHTADRPQRAYGLFEYGLTVTPHQTTVLPFTIWMPLIDTDHQVTIASPTTSETVITTPYIPGLELHLPAGSVIRDYSGNVITTVSITPIPVDRSPFPLPVNSDVPVYFTIQPGSARIDTPGPGPKGGWLVYPNYRHVPPGHKIQFEHYDPDEIGSYVYGLGTVTRDGSQVTADPGTRIYEFTGAMIISNLLPALFWPFSPDPSSGDRIDPASGVFVMHKTDLFLPDTIPLALTRTYNAGDTLVRPFGRGMLHPYTMFLWSAQQYQQADLVLPEGTMLHYVRTSAGTGWVDAVFVHQETQTTSATPTAFYKSVITWNGNGWNLRLTDGTTYVFGENAPLQAIVDRYGNRVTVSHANGQTGNVTRVTSPNGRFLTFAYDAANRVTSVTDNIGRAVAYTYDANSNLATVTDPENNVTTYTYDPATYQMLTITDGRNITYLTNQYTNSLVTRQTLADPTSTYQFAYTKDGNGNITQTDVTDPRGHVERLAFNANHFVVSDTQALGAPEQRTLTTERLAGSNLVSAVTDGLNRRTQYTYDSAGHLLTVTRLAGTPDAVTTTFTYEPVFSQLATVTDPLNHTWTVTYDTNGRLTGASDPLGHRTAAVMSANGQVTSVTDALQHTWQFGYTGGDLTSVTDPLNRTTTRFVDAAGRAVTTTDPLGRVTRTASDKLNRITTITDALGGQTAFAYDPKSNLLALTDALNHTTGYSYDTSDRVATRTDPLQQSASYVYDANDNLTQATDRKGQVTSFQYDALDRLTQVTYADNSTTQYTFDAGDRVTQIADSVGGTILRGYDLLDRLTTETTLQGAINYTYDAAGRRSSMTVIGQPTVNTATTTRTASRRSRRARPRSASPTTMPTAARRSLCRTASSAPTGGTTPRS